MSSDPGASMPQRANETRCAAPQRAYSSPAAAPTNTYAAHGNSGNSDPVAGDKYAASGSGISIVQSVCHVAGDAAMSATADRECRHHEHTSRARDEDQQLQRDERHADELQHVHGDERLPLSLGRCRELREVQHRKMQPVAENDEQRKSAHDASRSSPTGANAATSVASSQC